QPNDFDPIPTSSECQLLIKADVVADKDGEKVPSAQLGPYPFKIAPLDFVAATPAKPRDPTKPSTIDPADPLVLSFNAKVDPAKSDAAGVVIKEVPSCTDPAGTGRTAAVDQDPMDQTSLLISDANPPPPPAGMPDATSSWEHSKIITVTFTATAE